MKLTKKYLIPIFIIVIILTFSSFIVTAGEVNIHFIDVGQGDSILIQTSQNKNMLIDGEDKWDRVENKLISYLKELGIESIDVLLGTHPHADHIGGLPAVIRNFEVKSVYDSGKVHTSKTYENYLLFIDEKDIPFYTPKRGDVIELGDLEFKVLHPVGDVEEYDLNNSSIVLHLEYGEVSFLFTGDIEEESEKEILDSSIEVKSTILKVAHHGSSSSSSNEFIKEVDPEKAVIQVGENRYGHPHSETLDVLAANKVDIYRTDRYGDIKISTDGDNYTIETEMDAAPRGPPTKKTKEEAYESDKINVNTASTKKLETLHGVGQAISERIVEYRKEYGEFKNIEEIMNVKGIGEATFERWQDKVTVGPNGDEEAENVEKKDTDEDKLNINTASASKLQSLWGVGPATAENIIEYRENNGPFESIEEIIGVDGINKSKFNRWKDNIAI